MCPVIIGQQAVKIQYSLMAISHLSSVDTMINMRRMGAGSLKKWSTFHHHHHRLGHHHSPSGDWLTNYRSVLVQHKNINPTETFRPSWRQTCKTHYLKQQCHILSYHIKYQFGPEQTHCYLNMTNGILKSCDFKLTVTYSILVYC